MDNGPIVSVVHMSASHYLSLSHIWVTCTSVIRSGGFRISQKGTPTPKGLPPDYLTIFSHKTEEFRVVAYSVHSPRSANDTWATCYWHVRHTWATWKSLAIWVFAHNFPQSSKQKWPKYVWTLESATGTTIYHLHCKCTHTWAITMHMYTVINQNKSQVRFSCA